MNTKRKTKPPATLNLKSIPALVLRGAGHQFVCYADCCSGVPEVQHEANFAAVNGVVSRLSPQPEFICFPGDEVQGLTGDMDALREQWRYWLAHELGWLDRLNTPIYHTTGNHTTYDSASEAVFREMLPHLPGNGPPGQEGLSYFIRQGSIFVCQGVVPASAHVVIRTACGHWPCNP